jgi:hypothetical protein
MSIAPCRSSGGGDHPLVHSASVSASMSASGFDPEARMNANPQHTRPIPPPAGSPTGAPFRSATIWVDHRSQQALELLRRTVGVLDIGSKERQPLRVCYAGHSRRIGRTLVIV